MAVTTIPWNDGSGDNIYVSASSQVGDETVQVSSDANTGAARSQTVTFTSGVGGITRSLTVNQEGVPQEHTVVLYLTSYDTENKEYYSISGVSNAYSTDLDSTANCTINLTRGSQAETYVYFKFNTSSIPANATIVSVNCVVSCRVSNTSSGNVATRQVQMASGLTLKGDPTNLTTTITKRTLTTGTWTRNELNDARVRMYAKRGTSNTTTNYTMQIRCAQLTVKYTV